ncbi:MAG: hypothetical protein ACR2L5_01580 [Candidatus Actinomarinaceae bacterium]
MSILISSSIKEVIDLGSLTSSSSRHNKNSDQKCFVECYDGNSIIKLNFKELEKIDKSLFCIKVSVNLNIFEKLFFEKVKLKRIIIGNTSCNILKAKFKKSIENATMYDIFINLKVEEEFNV